MESYDRHAPVVLWREKFLKIEGPVVCFAAGLFLWSAPAERSGDGALDQTIGGNLA